MRKVHCIIWASIFFTLLSCKKNQEHVLEKELGEDVYLITNDLQGILYSQALLDKFAIQNFSEVADCLVYTSDTIAGKVSHVIHFQKSDYCDFYQDSTQGIITMSYNLNYGSLLDTVFLKYENFRSNGHYYNGTVKVLFTAFLNSSAYDYKVIVDDLMVIHKNDNYVLEGTFTRSYYDKIYHTDGSLTANLTDRKIESIITKTLESDGDYSFYNYDFNEYLSGGILKIPLDDHNYTIYFGVNGYYSNTTVCIDETGYRYVFSMDYL